MAPEIYQKILEGAKQRGVQELTEKGWGEKLIYLGDRLKNQ
jgi:hypothetical protein